MRKFIFMVVSIIVALSSIANAQNSKSMYYNEAVAEATPSFNIEKKPQRCNTLVYDTDDCCLYNISEQEPSSVPLYLIQQQRLERRYNNKLARIYEESSGYRRQEEQTQQGIFIGSSGLICSNNFVKKGTAFSLRAGYVYKGLTGYIEYSNRNFEKYHCYNGNYLGLGFEADIYRYSNYSLFFGGYTNVGKITSSQNAKDTIDAYLGADNTYPESAIGVTAGLTIGGKIYFGEHAFASIGYDRSNINYNDRFIYNYYGESNNGVKLAFGFIF